MLVYVDDLILAGNNSSAISKLKQQRNSRFHMKDLGVLKYFLGIEITRSNEGIFLIQRKYTLDILFKTGMLGTKPSEFPMEPYHQLARSSAVVLPYHHKVGDLLLGPHTRPIHATTDYRSLGRCNSGSMIPQEPSRARRFPISTQLSPDIHLLWFQLGKLSIDTAFCNRVLCSHRWFPGLLEDKETTHCLSFVSWSGIPSHGPCLLWALMPQILTHFAWYLVISSHLSSLW